MTTNKAPIDRIFGNKQEEDADVHDLQSLSTTITPVWNDDIDSTLTTMTRRQQLLLLSSGILLAASTTIKIAAPDAATAATLNTIDSKFEEARERSKPLVSAPTTSSTTVAESSAVSIQWEDVFRRAGKKALGGGKAGAAAAVVQVCSLMWLRTSMNYQYRYGGTLRSSLSTLWEEGGISRLYQGLPFALIQGPATRFGDTATNVGVLAILETIPETQAWPLPLKTACGSVAAGVWRIVLMPIDASKTIMQVDGPDGLTRLWFELLPLRGPSVLYQGALAQAAATVAGNFPWFYTYNSLDLYLPQVENVADPSTVLFLTLARSAIMGVSASCVSDCISNSLRVIKTTKQTAEQGEGTTSLSYTDVVQSILQTDGYIGLFGRGLQTRLLTNAIQGAVFSILWKYFQQLQQ